MKKITKYLGNDNLECYQMVTHSKEWHEFRMNGFGGSEAASIMGMNKYEPRLKLWLEKIGYLEKEDKRTGPLVWGTALEDVVLNMWRYMDHTPDGYLTRYTDDRPVREFELIPGYVVNKKFPWLFHSPDALITEDQPSIYTGEVLEDKGVLEAKTIDPNYARQWEKGYPEYYKYQLQQYLMGLELGYAELTVFSMDRRQYGDFMFSDYDIQTELVERSHDLWDRVLKGREIMAAGLGEDELINELSQVQPDLTDDNPESLNEFLSRNTKLNKEMVIGGENIRRAAVNLQKLGKMKKLMEDMRVKYELEIREFLWDQRAYRIEFEGEDNGYIRLSSRKNSDKLTMTNKVKADHSEDIKYLEQLWGHLEQ